MSQETNDNHAHEPGFGPDVEHANGRRALATLGQYLEEDGWYPQALADQDTYRMPYRGRNGSFQCYARVRLEGEQFIFYAVAPVKVDEAVRPAVAEYITRANYGLYIGNFELDYSDGEVRFKTSIDFEDETLSPTLIRNTVYPAVRLMDQYLPGLLKVAFGGQEPAAAIAEIEG